MKFTDVLFLALAAVAAFGMHLLTETTAAVEDRPVFAPSSPTSPAAVTLSAPEPQWTTQAQVLRVIDGDTIEVEVKRTFRVRMLDCWAPESRRDPRRKPEEQAEEKAKGQASKEHLTALAEGKTVVVSIPLPEDGDVAKIWTMGRVLGRVWLLDRPGKSLSVQQVEAGHATETKPGELK